MDKSKLSSIGHLIISLTVSNILSHAQTITPQCKEATSTLVNYENTHFNFSKSSENFKYTIGAFSTSLQNEGDKQSIGISTGIIVGRNDKKGSVELKYAKSGNNSVMDMNVYFLIFPTDLEFSPYIGVGVGSTTREIEGVTLTNFFGTYNARIATGIELFSSSDYRIYLGADIIFPIGKSDAMKTETYTDNTTGNKATVVKTFESRSTYTDFIIRIAF